MHQVRRPSRMAFVAVTIAKESIDKNPLSFISTDDLAEMTGISRNLLQKRFREIYGKKIKEYQLDVRLEASCEMLREGRMSIKQIALKCGYSDQCSFAHAFKKKFNQSPTDWQNENGADLAF